MCLWWGDVKQSIYRFRLARPELFMDKYERYSVSESLHQKIELHQNFRSRATVLDSVNDVFYKIMTRALGGIRYTEETALHPGAQFAPGERTSTPTELLLVDTGADAPEAAGRGGDGLHGKGAGGPHGRHPHPGADGPGKRPDGLG